MGTGVRSSVSATRSLCGAAATLLVVCVTAGPVRAGAGAEREAGQVERSEATVGRGPALGMVLGGNVFDVGERLQDFGRAYDNRMSVGARLQYAVSPRWAVEGSLLFTAANLDLTGVRIEEGKLREVPREDRLVDEVDVATYYTMANFILNLQTTGEWIPYVTAGAGVVTLDVAGAGVENRPGGNLGVGALFVPSESFAVRLEVRDYFYDLGDLDVATSGALSLPPSIDETINDLAFSIGLSYLF